MPPDAAITITPIELLALKKLTLINSALAKTLASRVAGGEQLALTRVLIDIVNRAELALSRAELAQALAGEREAS